MDEREEKSARIERLERLIAEDTEILRHVREVAKTCSLRLTQLSCKLAADNLAADAVSYMTYNMAERDLEDLENLIEAEKWNSKNELKKLEGEK